MGNRVIAAVALGSNLGDRSAHLNYAVSRLRDLLAGLRVSRFYDTVPVGAPGPQALFLNAAAVGATELTARELLTALLALENEAAASVTFSAYDFFDSDEFHHWIAEGGTNKPRDRHGSTRAGFLARTDEIAAHQDLGFGGRVLPIEQPHLPHFGVIVATCERGDLRLSPDGVLIHGVDGTREVAVPCGIGRPGQGDALDALWAALREERRCVHDARWGRATVQVVLAMLQSSRTCSEVLL